MGRAALGEFEGSGEKYGECGTSFGQNSAALGDNSEHRTAEGALNMAQKSEGAKYVLTSDMDAVAPAAGIAAKAYGHTLHLAPRSAMDKAHVRSRAIGES